MAISDLRDKLDSKQISAVELTKSYLDKIHKFDTNINSYITVCDEIALKQAKNAQKRIDNKNAAFLTGIPLSVKDNICTDKIKTTCASKILSDFVPFYNATVIERLLNEDAIILGKTNMDEFAMGSTNETSYFGKVKNPINTDYVPGGSSGGAAASVAADFCAAALGSDTGGSVRQPAAYCGVTGFKPSYGILSRFGLIAYASSFDTIGFLTKSAKDIAYLMNATAGKDSKDATTISVDNDYTKFLDMSIKGLRIGIPKEFFDDELSENAKKAILSVAEFYKSCGAKLVDISFKSFAFAKEAYKILTSAEASSNLSRYDGMKYGHASGEGETYKAQICSARSDGFGNEVRKRILFGGFVLSAENYDNYYKKALSVRQAIKNEYNEIFTKCDVLLSPTTATSAYKFRNENSEFISNNIADKYTMTANLAGLPSISSPCGYDNNNMPFGMCLTGKNFDDARVIAIADIFEKHYNQTTGL